MDKFVQVRKLEHVRKSTPEKNLKKYVSYTQKKNSGKGDLM
jgi:hypothetical protein